MQQKLGVAIELIRQEYERVWSDWYRDRQHARACLNVHVGFQTSGYSPEADEIHLWLPESNLIESVNWGAANPHLRSTGGYSMQWMLWKIELIHEMLHEFQGKVFRDKASHAGLRLYENNFRSITGPGHDARFYSAIADRAEYFGMTPVQLLASI